MTKRAAGENSRRRRFVSHPFGEAGGAESVKKFNAYFLLYMGARHSLQQLKDHQSSIR